ncbi:hypothetical protein L6164_036684 [Bauhinia variegata]|uniref:Uncharacterized protein n=1 Tax=Bauhinia variegata TaxID=167791 RepID=A0ACB9KHY3_BAUVA|nr:hypothetical protein L6164_036684 [Bauhinia variegata]
MSPLIPCPYLGFKPEDGIGPKIRKAHKGKDSVLPLVMVPNRRVCLLHHGENHIALWAFTKGGFLTLMLKGASVEVTESPRPDQSFFTFVIGTGLLEGHPVSLEPSSQLGEELEKVKEVLSFKVF